MSGKSLSHNTSYNINISIIITSNNTSPSVLLSAHPSIISKITQNSPRLQIYRINIASGQKVDFKFVKTNHAKLKEKTVKILAYTSEKYFLLNGSWDADVKVWMGEEVMLEPDGAGGLVAGGRGGWMSVGAPLAHLQPT